MALGNNQQHDGYIGTENIHYSVFRTDSWVTAWLETYGKTSGVKLLGVGSSSPQNVYYLGKQLWKSLLPIHVLTPAGVQSMQVTSPRSEYNDLGFADTLNPAQLAMLRNANWQALNIPDVLNDSEAYRNIERLANYMEAKLYVTKTEQAYSIKADLFDTYVKRLAAPIRSKYFHKRERLHTLGVVEYQQLSWSNWHDFVKILNDFHLERWGRKCYSELSIEFLGLFCGDLIKNGGEVALECIRLNGRPVSVLFDVIWKGRRYNFQSGYDQNLKGISLGAIHLGYAIETAIGLGQVYDLMAGRGKVNNYKKDIATDTVDISSILLLRSYARYARAFYDALLKR